jgi:RES domain
MVAYDVPDDTPVARRILADLPVDWRRREVETQRIGDEWLAGEGAALLFVPSAIVPIADSPDENVIINHRHPAAEKIRIERVEASDWIFGCYSRSPFPALEPPRRSASSGQVSCLI